LNLLDSGFRRNDGKTGKRTFYWTIKSDLREKITELFKGSQARMKAMETTREPWQGPPWKLTGLRANMDL